MKNVQTFLILSLIFLFSCKNNNSHTEQFRAVIKSLENSNEMIRETSGIVYEEFEGKRNDPRTAEKARIWYPRVKQVHVLSTNVIAFINELKDELKNESGLDTDTGFEIDNSNEHIVERLFVKQGKAGKLYQKLIAYKQEAISLPNLDEFSYNPSWADQIKNDFGKIKKFCALDIDKQTELQAGKALNNQDVGIAHYFENVNAIGALAMLYKLENDVLQTENMLVTYFNHMVIFNFCGYYEISPIITQSSSYLKPEQELEIYAGVGEFTVAAKPVITINGVKARPGPGGIVISKLKAGSKPGKYAVPIKIEFIAPDGSTKAVTKKIEYTVAE